MKDRIPILHGYGLLYYVILYQKLPLEPPWLLPEELSFVELPPPE